MKIIRLFALSLVVAGVVSSPNPNALKLNTNVSSNVLNTKYSVGLPVPTCPPDDPNGCGIAQLGK